MFASVQRAWEMGAAGVGATIYFGSPESNRQIVEVAQAFEEAHRLGHVHRPVVLPAQHGFKVDGTDYHAAADLTGQANHLGVTIEADIIKQKLPENNGGYTALNANGASFGKTHKLVYEKLTTDNPIDLTPLPGAQLLPGPRAAHQLAAARRRARPTSPRRCAPRSSTSARAASGLISGRKAFQRPMDEGIALLNAIQDVYLSPEVTVA